MATKRKRAAPKRTRRPKAPARVRKKRTKPARSHQHAELWGLSLVAVGLFLGCVLWLGWDGGEVGSQITGWLDQAIGSAAFVLPLILCSIGGLMLVRSELVDMRPFRTGIVVALVGLMIALGEDHGGALGGALGGAVAAIIGVTGSAILGAALLLAGGLLLTGASAGAILRRSGSAVRTASSAARRTLDSLDWSDDTIAPAPAAPRPSPRGHP